MRGTGAVALVLLSALGLGISGCLSTRPANRTGCESLGVVPGATASAAGLVHAHPLEPEWLRRPLSSIGADSYLWDTWVDGWNVESRDALVSDSLFIEWELAGWEALQTKVEPGDQFWFYTTPDSYWNTLAGQEGVVLLRECAVVGTIVTSQS